MNKTTRLLLQLLLLLLVVATYLVFRFPEQTQLAMRPVFEFTALQKQLTNTHTDEEFWLTQYLSLLSSPQTEVTHTLIANPPIHIASGSSIDATIAISWSIIMYDETKQEAGNYTITLTTPGFIYGTEVAVAHDHKTNFLKWENQSLRFIDQEESPEPLIMVMKWLLEQYDETRINTNTPVLTLEQWLLHSMKRIRFLDVSKHETYIEADGNALWFSWTRNSDTSSFNWTIHNNKRTLTWSIMGPESWWYTLTMQRNKYLFNGKATIRSRWYTLQWTITSPKWVSFPVVFKSEAKKIARTRIPALPTQSIARSTITRNLRTLGVFE